MRNKKKKKYIGGGLLNTLGIDPSTMVQPALNTILGLFDSQQKPIVGPQSNSRNTNPYGMMKDGGYIETDDSKYIVGPDHNQGGVDITSEVEAEGGEKIITLSTGDKYVLPKKSSLKDKSDKYEKKYKNSSTDYIERNSLRMMNDKLAAENEVERMSKLGNQVQEALQAKYGGKIKAQDGLSLTDPPDPADPFGQTSLTVPGALDSDFPVLPSLYDKGREAFENAYTQDNIRELAPNLRMPDPDRQTGKNTPIDVAPALRGLGYAKNAFDLTRGATEEIPVLPDYSKADEAFDRVNTDLTQARQNILGVSQATKADIDRSTRSSAVRLSNLAQNAANLQDALGEIGLKEQGLRNTAAVAESQYEAGKATQTADIIRQNNLVNLQNQAQTRNVKRGIFSDFMHEADRLDTIKDNRNLASASTKEGMAMLEAMFPNFAIDQEMVTEFQQLARGEITEDQLSTKSKSLIKFKSE